MVKYIILFISLFSLSFLEYLPMSNIIDRFHIERICHYKEYNYNQQNFDDVEYVRPCENGFYCVEVSSNHEIGICQNYTSSTKYLGEECSSTFECDNNLRCNKQCTVKENDVYKIIDKASNESLYYCPNNMTAINDSSINDFYICKSKSNYQGQGKCYFKENGKIYNATPEYFQVCGKINKDQKNEIESIDINDLGSQENDEFVWDEKACKSGYAIYHPSSGNIADTNIVSMYKKCVTVTGVEKGDNDCIIKYKIKDEDAEITYNVDHLKNIANEKNIFIDDELFKNCQFLMKKLDLFKVYKKRLDDLKTKGVDCKNKKLYNESFTCGDDDLRKLWYSYNNPDLYLLYKDEPEVFDYLIQKAYRSYNRDNTEVTIEATDSSSHLDIKSFLALLLLLIF